MSWRLREQGDLASEVLVPKLSSQFRIPEWVARILANRMEHWSDRSIDAVQRFLEPSLKHLPDPFTLPDMDRAAERLAEAIVESQIIAIYGDYDVDGTVGSAILARFLRALGVEPIIYQPDRQREGYGVNVGAIETLARQGVQLLLTVDCGITSVTEIERANALGMDVVICDHHEPKEVLPPAYAVLDHKRKDNEGPIRSLCGAGVAFYLAIGTRSMLRDIGHFDADGGGKKEPDVREWLDLVALSIVADLVPLVDENRILLRAGLERMRRTPCIGIRELLRVAGIKPEEVSPYHLGFILGPRINASGRLGTANAALELLSTNDPIRARELAEHLDGINEERVNLQAEVAAEALAQAERFIQQKGDDTPALVLFSDNWHEGVIGIVASKVVEKYHRPVAIITGATHTGLGKGSVRGVNRVDVTKALEVCADLLKGFGGHKAAAGLTIEPKEIDQFRTRFEGAIESQVSEITKGSSKVLAREVLADAILESDEELTKDAVEFLEKLGPFGIGNPEPVLILSGWKINGVKVLKERHLKIQLQSQQNRGMEGFWANGSERWDSKELVSVDIACFPQINTFRNLNRLELKIKDMRARTH